MMDDIFVEKISKEDIQKLPLLAFEDEIAIVETQEELTDAVASLWKETLIGFDTESKPAFQKGQYNPTCLIQLSTETTAYLFRLNLLPDATPLFELLEDKGITKLGISIADDLKDLQKMRKFAPQGFVDLNDLAKEIGVKHIGVRKLAAIFLNKRISKNQQTSNWENEELSASQQKYAATDAWICLQIHKEMLLARS